MHYKCKHEFQLEISFLISACCVSFDQPQLWFCPATDFQVLIPLSWNGLSVRSSHEIYYIFQNKTLSNIECKNGFWKALTVFVLILKTRGQILHRFNTWGCFERFRGGKANMLGISRHLRSGKHKRNLHLKKGMTVRVITENEKGRLKGGSHEILLVLIEQLCTRQIKILVWNSLVVTEKYCCRRESLAFNVEQFRSQLAKCRLTPVHWVREGRHIASTTCRHFVLR